jgi:hypothetical protein
MKIQDSDKDFILYYVKLNDIKKNYSNQENKS